MKSSIDQLYNISNKNSKRIIGLMSGTSLDGLDIALCDISGNGKDTSINLLNFTTIPYDDYFKNEITCIASKKEVELERVCMLNEAIARNHAAMINECLIKWGINNSSIDLIASHGQTIYHAPEIFHKKDYYKNATLQIGDGDHIATLTGIITISDFRQKHVAAGGEGAPLVSYGDYLLFAKDQTNKILLNIGGIANLTFIPANANFEDIISTDIGPGNTLMDKWIKREIPEMHFDNNGEMASKGNINIPLLNKMLSHPFFSLPLPKTTGPELFNLAFIDMAIRELDIPSLSIEDMMATLNKLTTVSICHAINKIIPKNATVELMISGGGFKNNTLISNLKNELQACIFKDHTLHADAKEAMLFAILANEMLSGKESTFGKGSPYQPNISMGKISFPY